MYLLSSFHQDGCLKKKRTRIILSLMFDINIRNFDMK